MHIYLSVYRQHVSSIAKQLHYESLSEMKFVSRRLQNMLVIAKSPVASSSQRQYIFSAGSPPGSHTMRYENTNTKHAKINVRIEISDDKGTHNLGV